VFAIAIALGFGALLALVSSSQLDSDLPADLRELILRTSFGSSIITTALISTVLCVSAPPRTSLQSLLDLLPVSRRDAQVGQMLPLLLIGSIFSLALSSMSVAVFTKVNVDAVQMGISVLLLLISIVIVQLFIVGLFQLISNALRRYIRLPHQYSVSIAAVITIGISVGSVIGDVFALTPTVSPAFELRDLLINRVLASLAVNPSDFFAWLLFLSWIGVAGVVFALSGATQRQDSANATIALFRGTMPRQGHLNASIWMEFLVGVRTPQTIVALLASIPFIAIVYWMLTVEFLADRAAASSARNPTTAVLSRYVCSGQNSQVPLDRRSLTVGSFVVDISKDHRLPGNWYRDHDPHRRRGDGAQYGVVDGPARHTRAQHVGLQRRTDRRVPRSLQRGTAIVGLDLWCRNRNLVYGSQPVLGLPHPVHRPRSNNCSHCGSRACVFHCVLRNLFETKPQRCPASIKVSS
jgi:hypothetical protein